MSNSIAGYGLSDTGSEMLYNGKILPYNNYIVVMCVRICRICMYVCVVRDAVNSVLVFMLICMYVSL